MLLRLLSMPPISNIRFLIYTELELGVLNSPLTNN